MVLHKHELVAISEALHIEPAGLNPTVAQIEEGLRKWVLAGATPPTSGGVLAGEMVGATPPTSGGVVVKDPTPPPSGGDRKDADDGHDSEGDDAKGDDGNDSGDDDDDNMKVIVRDITGGEFMLKVSIADTVLSMKVQIRMKKGTQTYNQQLVHGDKEMNDKHQLEHYGVKDGSVISLTVLIIGGAGNVKKDKLKQKGSVPKTEKVAVAKLRMETAFKIKPPPTIQPDILTKAVAKMDEMRKAVNPEYLKQLLSECKTKDLMELFAVLNEGKNSELKVTKWTRYVVAEMSAVEVLKIHTESISDAMEAVFFYNYCNSYYDSEAMLYNHEQFKTDVKDELLKRGDTGMEL